MIRSFTLWQPTPAELGDRAYSVYIDSSIQLYIDNNSQDVWYAWNKGEELQFLGTVQDAIDWLIQLCERF